MKKTKTRTVGVTLVFCLAFFSCGGHEDDEVHGGMRMQERLLSDEETIDLFSLSEAVDAREEAVGFEGLSKAERVFFCVWSLEAEVNNGGFEQFFANATGDHAAETIEALQTVGASRMAGMAQRANAVFGPAGVPQVEKKRWKAMSALGEEAITKWEEIDNEFYETDSAWEVLSAYVEQHRAQFFKP